jgi:septal ring factor EnvC (AmiA/AmiB activator)
VLRLKSPATEKEAIDTALRVLQTQLAQVDDQATAAAARLLSEQEFNELAQTRRSLEELVQLVSGRAQTRQNLEQQATQLNLQLATLNRQRDQLVEQQKALERQFARTQAEVERLKLEMRRAAEEAKTR